LTGLNLRLACDDDVTLRRKMGGRSRISAVVREPICPSLSGGPRASVGGGLIGESRMLADAKQAAERVLALDPTRNGLVAVG
jgi:hypothetical protein